MRFYVTDERSWASNTREAYRLAQEDGSQGLYRPIDVPTGKVELLAFLNTWCGPVPRDGEGDRPQDGGGGSPPDASAPAKSDLEFRTDLAERWDNLPLPFCLDLAALALDRARSALPIPSEAERTH